MSELTRLLESSESEDTRAILRAGLADAPPPETLPRIAAALGVSAAALGVAVPVGAALNGTAAAGAVAAGGGATAMTGASVAVLSKWLVTGVVGGMLASGTAFVVERARDSGATAQSAVTSAARAPERPRPARPVSSARGPSAADSLGAEAARIDAARRALARGELAQASRELDRYQEERALGVLDREALLLRIQLLVRRGEHARAVLLAQSYLTAHPNDAHTARLRALIEQRGKTWPGPEGIDR
jgi:hypothetical protein